MVFSCCYYAILGHKLFLFGAHMTRPCALAPGNCYFLVNYHDEKLLLPYIQTLIYESCSTTEEGDAVWVFVDASSSQIDESPDLAVTRFGFEEEQLAQILEFDELQAVLVEIAMLHPLSPGATVCLIKREDVLKNHPIFEQIERFLTSVSPSSMHIQIRYTDDGFFLEKTTTSFSIDFYTHPLRNPLEDQRVLAIFEQSGVEANTNYLADAGRTRILGYRIEPNADHLARLTARLLTEVFEMRSTDELQFIYRKKID